MIKNKKLLSLTICLFLVLFSLTAIISPDNAAAAGSTTSITVTKYAADGTTIIDQTTQTWEWMRDNLTVYGDGITHYYFQGPTFDPANLWDPDEMINIDSRDYGACQGTDVKELCDLVGGAAQGDVIKIKSPDGFSKSFDYQDIYNPEPQQGKLVVTWYTRDAEETTDGYVSDGYTTGMRLIFFAETLNPDGKHVFGLWDMHQYLAESRWHYYYDGTSMWPSSSGLSVKYISNIDIYTSGGGSSAERASDNLTVRANVILSDLGIALNRDAIDFGDIKPGENSATETVLITNTGSVDVYITVEVRGQDQTAQDFYAQSLYVNNNIYNINTIIANILKQLSANAQMQLKVPSTWNTEEGEQQATIIFWAEASAQNGSQ